VINLAGRGKEKAFQVLRETSAKNRDKEEHV
jgi:hypothetical protein